MYRFLKIIQSSINNIYIKFRSVYTKGLDRKEGQPLWAGVSISFPALPIFTILSSASLSSNERQVLQVDRYGSFIGGKSYFDRSNDLAIESRFLENQARLLERMAVLSGDSRFISASQICGAIWRQESLAKYKEAEGLRKEFNELGKSVVVQPINISDFT